MVTGVNGSKGTTAASSNNKKKAEETLTYKVKSGDTVAKLAKLYNFKSESEFREYFKMASNAQVKVGQELKVPTTPFETTFFAIVRKYNIPVAELKKLNPQIKNFDQIKKGTPIIVPVRPFGTTASEQKNNKPTTTTTTTTTKNTPKAETKAEVKTEPKPEVKDTTVTETKPEDSEPVPTQDTPAQIAQALKDSASKIGALSKDEFKTPFSKINKDNVIEVIQEYDKISKGESLIEMICDETSNDDELNQNAVKQLFGTLCERLGSAVSEDVKKGFYAELKKQYDSMWVSTTKMDNIINALIASDTPENIAAELKKSASQKGAIDKPTFTIPFSRINKENVVEVIQEYDKISKDESLIEMIADEISNDEELRKSTIKQLSSTLNERVGEKIATEDIKTEFNKEVDDQFDDMWVSTNKMDKMVDAMLASDSPAQIAADLKKSANKKGAIDKFEFKIPFSKINKDNVIEVIKEYDKISKGESLIEMICDEISNEDEVNKAAVKRLFSLLCDSLGYIADEGVQKEFYDELEKQYGDLWVSTKKMDKIVNTLITAKEQEPPTTWDPTNDKNAPNKYVQGTNFPLSNNSNKVYLPAKDSVRTVMDLRNTAHQVASKAGMTTTRPEPLLNEDGVIVARVKEFEPLNENGKLSGKTIIINAGHGGYNPNTGIFDAGAHVKQDENVAEEWIQNRKFADKIIPQLQHLGAKVIYMDGSALNIMTAKEQYPNADAFVSIHCDSSDKKDISGQSIYYFDGKDDKNKKYESANGKKFAQIMEKHLDTVSTIDEESCTAKGKHLGVLKSAPNIPSVLIEIGFMTNASDLEKITSESFQEEVSTNIINGIIEMTTNEETLETSPIDSTYATDTSNVSNASDVAEFVDLSEDYIQKLSDIEEFHNDRYKDKAGNLTIGVGHLWKEGEPTSLTDKEVYQLLAKDLQKTQKQLVDLLGRDTYNKLPKPIKEALVDMAFNKGTGTIKRTEGLVWALQNERYEGAICMLTFNKSTKTGEEMSGLNKRRLFGLSLATKYYTNRGKAIPTSVMNTAQQVYDRGVELLKTEYGNKYTNILPDYNENAKKFWGEKLALEI